MQPKTKWPLIASFLRFSVFVRDFNQSAIKGHFCAFLVSSILLTSLSTDLTSHFWDQLLLTVRLLICFLFICSGKQCLQRFVRNPFIRILNCIPVGSSSCFPLYIGLQPCIASSAVLSRFGLRCDHELRSIVHVHWFAPACNRSSCCVLTSVWW